MASTKEMIDDDGKRVFIHPSEVKGRLKNARVAVRTILVIFILGLPWIKMRGHQALLLDIVHRKFSIFGFLFFAQDVPLLFLLVINFVLGVALVTALFGRVWCGWMCPQTVFVEGIFRKIEKWTEGSAEQRRKQEALPMTTGRVLRKTLKWALYSICTLWVTHSILAIFIGSDHLLEMLARPFSENPTSLIFILISNLVLLADFGWLREQFCILACPYGKFQSVLQDKFTISVMYNNFRGEPRRGLKNKENAAGDCVNCFRCVRVCPTGIDIRDGSQLECIACTACMDACDDVMTRLKKPKGLIAYHSEARVQGVKQQWLRPRIWIYSSMIGLFGGVAFFQILTLKPFEVMLYKTKGNPFLIVRPTNTIESVTNVFTAELSNKSSDPIQITFQMNTKPDIHLVMPNNPLTLAEGEIRSNPFTVEFDKNILSLGSADTKAEIKVKDLVTGQEWNKSENIHLIGPF